MTLDLEKIKAICFDIDGTLRDTDNQYVARLEKIFSPLKIFLSEKKIASFSRWLLMASETPGNILMSIPDLLGLDNLFLKGNNQKAPVISKHHMKMVPGAMDAVNNLKEKYDLAIVSARRKSKVDQFIRENELGSFFPVVVSAISAKRNKPHPAPVLYASTKLGVDPENILMVGDTTYDILTGKRAGAQTIGVLSGFGTHKELLRVGADQIMDSVADLTDILIA